MTLRELRLVAGHRFYQQDWFDREPFMDRDIPVTSTMPPAGFRPGLAEPDDLSDAVLVAACYVAHPYHPVWKYPRRFWTADTDEEGHRIYLQDRGYGLEIHRHLHLTPDFGCAIW